MVLAVVGSIATRQGGERIIGEALLDLEAIVADSAFVFVGRHVSFAAVGGRASCVAALKPAITLSVGGSDLGRVAPAQ
ncbi:MAG: hypothetical protein AAFN30_15075 [Actinomycetota bacterium]